MRHRVKGKKFGREKGHRDLMLRNLACSLVEHGRISTTQSKAKELRSLADRIITYGKKGELHHRRLAFRILQNRTLVKKVFDELAPQYLETNGGYTRVLKNGYRKGDCAPMAIIEFVGHKITVPDKKKAEDSKK